MRAYSCLRPNDASQWWRAERVRHATGAESRHPLHSSLGRKLVEFIKIVLHGFMRRLKLVAILKPLTGHLMQFPRNLCHRPLAWTVKLACVYLIVLVPQSVQSSAIFDSQEMPHALYTSPDGRLRSNVKLSDLMLRKGGNLLSDKYSERVLGSLSAIFVTNVESNAADYSGSNDWNVWNDLAQMILFIMMCWLPIWVALRPNQ